MLWDRADPFPGLFAPPPLTPLPRLEKAFFQEARISIDPGVKAPSQRPGAWEQLPLTCVTSFFLPGVAMSLRLAGLSYSLGCTALLGEGPNAAT